MKTYNFTISGMTCHSCESLITMDLEEAGLPAPESISNESGIMKIQLEDDQVELVKKAIADTNKYKVESVETV
ncbi:MAG: heavy-metal-associated domain-containing protein [bacterium]|nr:heavy-metal-associated domain-containing protein [bacterium]